MNEEQRIKVIEEELKILKNEVKSVLLDLREQYLNIQNPFNFSMTPNLASANADTNPEQPNKKENDISPDDLIDGNSAKDMKETEDNNILGSSYLFDSPKLNKEIDFGSGQEAPSLYVDNSEPLIAPGLPLNNTFMNTSPAAMKPESINIETSTDKPDEIPEPLNIIQKTKNKKPENTPSNGNTKYDLVVVAGLTQWVDQATMKLGKERAEALVEMSYTMGRIPEHLKDVLIKMARLSRSNSDGHSVTATDYLSMLAQLENLLGNAEIKDNALLSLLSMNKESAGG